MPILRKYQEDLVQEVIQSFDKYKSIMLQMPTGTGKTHVFCEIIRRCGVNTLVLVHTRELVDQAENRLKEFGITCGIFMAGKSRNDSAYVQVASIQTLSRREIAEWPKSVSLIIIDEAHHATASSYQIILNHYIHKDLKILGVTATPCRYNGEGFVGTFEKLITAHSISYFIYDLKRLSDFKCRFRSMLTLHSV